MPSSQDDIVTTGKFRNQQLGSIWQALGDNSSTLVTALSADTALITAAISTASGNVVAAIAANTAAITAALLPITGSFTLGAAATTVVTQAATAANSIIVCFPTNAAAGTLVSGANSPYLSAKSAGVSFTIATAGGGAAAGTETFNYIMINP